MVNYLFTKGELLELCVVSSLYLNSKHSNKKWEETFNFLKGQSMEQKINSIQIFPKVTYESFLIDLKDIKLEEISKNLTCLPEQFNDLIKYVPDKSLLFMRGMSSSMDIMYLYSQNISISFHCKDIDKNPSFNQIEDEMKKVPYSNKRKDLIIIVPIYIQKDFLPFINCNIGFSIFNEGKYYILDNKYLVLEIEQELKEIYFQDGNFPVKCENSEIYFIKEGKNFFLCPLNTLKNHVFSVRKNMSLIILQIKGLKELIGEKIYQNLI